MEINFDIKIEKYTTFVSTRIGFLCSLGSEQNHTHPNTLKKFVTRLRRNIPHLTNFAKKSQALIIFHYITDGWLIIRGLTEKKQNNGGWIITIVMRKRRNIKQ